MSNKKGLIAGIVAGALVLGGGVTVFAIANHNKVKVKDVSVEETVTDLDAENAGGLGDVSSMTDAASVTEAASADETLTPLMAALKAEAEAKGVAEVGLFEGISLNAENSEKKVDFGYTSTGVLEAETLEQDPSLMLVYYLGTDSRINVALYKDNGTEATCVSDIPLSYETIYEQKFNYFVSNELVNVGGTEGFLSAKTIQKDGVTYLVTENNNWYVTENMYQNDAELTINPDTRNYGSFAIYKVTTDGIEGLYKMQHSAYGMDGGGSIEVLDFNNELLEEYRYGDLGDNPHPLEYFMDEYNQAVTNIGFPELTNEDKFALVMQGVLGEGKSWNIHWKCNTHLAEGDNSVSLELTENSIVSANWREWELAAPVAEEATSTDAAGTVSFDTPSQSVEEDEARYSAFFANNYAEFDDSMYLSANGIAVRYAYADLDKDGLDEMLIGDNEGVYAVITEVAGAYNISKVCGWRVQYGATPCEYLGGGCFVGDASNGNNYGGEFMIDYLLKYNGALHDCGVLARLSSSWDPNSVGDNLNNWELYVANDENSLLSRDESFDPSNTNYTYSYIDYGKNYNFVDGELESNDLMDQFNSLVAQHTGEGALESLTWYELQ